MLQRDTTPSASRPRSYAGGYRAAGLEGEEIIMNFLRANHVMVCDVRSDPQSQCEDVDFLIRPRDDSPLPLPRRWIRIEVKSDQHLGKGNWLFEIQRVNHTAPLSKLYVQGWSARSAAEIVFFYAPLTGTIHSVLMADYRLACNNALRDHMCRFDYVRTDAIKTTLNIYFQERYVHAMPSYKVYRNVKNG